MTEQQKKRRDDLAKKAHAMIKDCPALKWEYVEAFKAGYDACAKDAEVLVHALEKACQEIADSVGDVSIFLEDEPESLLAKCYEALTAWREGRGKEEE